MRNNDILYFVGEYLDDGLRAALADGSVYEIHLVEESGTLYIGARFKTYTPPDILRSAQNQIRNALGIRRVTIDPVYPPSEFGIDRMDAVIAALKAENPAANGYFDDSQIEIDDENAQIVFNIKNGDELVILGDTTQGIALIPKKGYEEFFDMLNNFQPLGDE